MRSVHQDKPPREQELVLDLDEIARQQGARKMLAHALQAEVEAYYLRAAEGERDECGRALVVKNGYARRREIVCGAGTIEVRAPRVNDKRVDEASGERKRFRSAILYRSRILMAQYGYATHRLSTVHRRERRRTQKA